MSPHAPVSHDGGEHSPVGAHGGPAGRRREGAYEAGDQRRDLGRFNEAYEECGRVLADDGILHRLTTWASLATLMERLPRALDAQLQESCGLTHFEFGLLGRPEPPEAYRRGMTGRAEWAAALRAMPPSTWASYLSDHSGLPGPRANLELVAAFAPLAEESTVDALLATGDEYHALCAAAALGLRAEDSASEKRARELAADARWRVREGVAIGLQLLGDSRPSVLSALVDTWVDDPHPLIQRAAVAAICEPRLLRDPRMAALALDACARTTEHLVSQTHEQRKTPEVRILRLALGYCWSVAIAADPARGLPVFTSLDTGDPDVAWMVTQNSRKKRLSRLFSN